MCFFLVEVVLYKGLRNKSVTCLKTKKVNSHKDHLFCAPQVAFQLKFLDSKRQRLVLEEITTTTYNTQLQMQEEDKEQLRSPHWSAFKWISTYSRSQFKSFKNS